MSLSRDEKEKRSYIQLFIYHPGPKSDSWVGDFEVSIRGLFNLLE
jgi:hypothetical protein